MPYINFKEEKFKAEQILDKRKNQYGRLYSELKQNHSKIDLDYNKKYSYNIINNRTIFTSDVEEDSEFKVVRNQNYICTHFIECKIYNVKFIDCIFVGCIFEKCDLGGGGIIFQNCTFIQETLSKKPSLNLKDNFACIFLDCKIYSKFANCNLSYCIFEKSEFNNSSFEISDLTHVIMKKCNYKNVSISDSDLSSCKILYPDMYELFFNDKYKSKFDDKTFFDKINFKSYTKEEYEGIYRIYQDIANEYNNNNLKNNFGEYYFLGKITQRKTLKVLPRIASYINYCVCGYGERVVNALITSLIIIFSFGVIYLITGVEFDGEVVKYISLEGLPKSIIEFLAQYNESLNMSISIFCGIGTSNSYPIYSSNILFDLEMIIGIIMEGIAIGTITRKLIR